MSNLAPLSRLIVSSSEGGETTRNNLSNDLNTEKEPNMVVRVVRDGHVLHDYLYLMCLTKHFLKELMKPGVR